MTDEKKDILVIPQSLSTSKKRDGDDFDLLLNVSAEVQKPDAQKAGWLFSASYSNQNLYLGEVVCHASSLRVRRPKGGDENEVVTVNLVLEDPRLPDVQRMFELVRDSVITPLTECQGSFDLGIQPEMSGENEHGKGEIISGSLVQIDGFKVGDRVVIKATGETGIVQGLENNHIWVVDQGGIGKGRGYLSGSGQLDPLPDEGEEAPVYAGRKK